MTVEDDVPNDIVAGFGMATIASAAIAGAYVSGAIGQEDVFAFLVVASIVISLILARWVNE